MEKNGTLASPAMARASNVLPVPGGADQQYALGNASFKLLELLRILQEVDDLLQFFLGLVDSSHILEGSFLLLRGQQARAGLAETQRLVSARLHLAHHDDPEADQQEQRSGRQQEIHPIGARYFFDID